MHTEPSAYAEHFTLRPGAELLVVLPILQTRKSGVILPETSQKTAPIQIGLVVAAGPGRLLDNGVRADPQYHVGEEVLFSRVNSQEVRQGEDVTLVILDERNVLGALTRGHKYVQHELVAK